MHTFENVATSNLDTKSVPATLPSNAKVVKTEGDKTVVKSVESLTVPTTAEELISLVQSTTDTVEMKLGEKTFTMNVVVASYVRDQKLQSQQAMQAALRGDGKTAVRNITTAWFLAQSPTNVAEYLRNLQSTEKAKNAWLDGLYAANKAAVDEYAKQAK